MNPFFMYKMNSNDINEAIKLFHDVRKNLEIHKNLPYAVAQDALRKCIPLAKTSEAQLFLDEYFYKIIDLLLKQTNKVDVYEKECIEKCCEMAIDIIIQLLPDHCQYLKVLEKIFDRNCLFYTGFKNGWAGIQGYPQVRLVAIKRFAESKGYIKLYQYLRKSGWPGAETLYCILLSVYEAFYELHCIESNVFDAYCRYSMETVLSLNDDQVKEGTKQMKILVRVIYNFLGQLSRNNTAQKLSENHIFLLEHIVRLVNSSSFVVKLYGWELISDIVKEAISHRPPAKGFLIQGAGNELVNGHYKYVGDHNDAHKYQKSASYNEPLLTMFRCTLEDKKKLWYISEADEVKPGTNSDKDYYQHKPSTEEQKEPPLKGWVVSNSKTGMYGRDPPPVLTRLESVIPAGMTEEMYLYYKVPLWVRDNSLLGKLFGESAHPEIVNRSLKLMLFLAESGSLKDEDIHLIWKAAVQSHDNALVDEFFNLLVGLSQNLKEQQYNVLIDCALETLQQDEHCGLAKVSQFVEKFSTDGVMLNLPSKDAALKLLGLSWAVYKNPSFESLKNGSVIQDLLSKCLVQKGGNLMALASVRECTSLLQSYNSGDAKVNEVAVARVIQTMQFLISVAHIGQDGIKQLDNDSFSSILIDEIKRFVKLNRSKSTSKASSKWYMCQLSNRLQLMRQFFGICRDVKITTSIVDTLCLEFKDNNHEMEEFLAFLKRGTQEAELEIFGNLQLLNHVFSKIICQGFVNWSNSGDEAFECFSAYFSCLHHSIAQQNDPMKIVGLDTLWRIYLSVPTETAQQQSIDLLLCSYDELVRVQPDAFEVMTNKIFEYLNQENAKVGRADSSEHSIMTISRCIELLVAVVRKSLSAPAHAAMGCMSRELITIKHRKLIQHYDHFSRSNVMKVDKNSEGVISIEVHPMHTVGDLKKKILSNYLSGGNVIKPMIEKNGKKIDDNVRLFQVRPYDNGQLRFSYQIAHWPSRGEDFYGDSREESFSNLNLNPAEMIRKEADFQCLLNLAERVDDANISSKIWDLVMMLPSQSAISTEIGKQLMTGNATSWSTVFSADSLANAAYKLQMVDSILLPAPEFRTEDAITRAIHSKKSLIDSDGISCVFKFLTGNFQGPKAITRSLYSSCLHVIHILLFGSDSQAIDVDRTEAKELVTLMQQNSGVIVEKLLAIASDAAASEQSDIVHNALHTLTYLLKSPEIISQLISNPQSKTLLITVLKSGLKRVRQMACDFAIQVGKAQPIVFKWLLAELDKIEFDDELCSDMFRALNELLDELSSTPTAIDYSELASLISNRLMEYPRNKSANPGGRHVLYGYLELLAKLIVLNYKAVESTVLGSQLVEVIVSDFLFTIPSDYEDKSPICDTTDTKQVAFKVLLALVSVSPSSFQSVLEKINKLSQNISQHIKDSWGLQVLHDMRKADISHSGLKNQGCTCYMNSLLQQLFMNVPFREAILRAPLLECHRTILWHRTNEEIVGFEVLLEWHDGSWRKGTIASYDSTLNRHEVHYLQYNDKAFFNIREGRYQKETGRVRIPPCEAMDPIKDSEDHAYRVLEQLQRTFAFMKHSKRRYFDPRPFVEACKTLNMNFSVYQQNDAAEFYDQLLDRIEIATKGIHTKIDVWNDVILKRSFGAQTLYQKIPTDCEIYSTKKEECGHWQGSRVEPFLKLEFMIRGKEKIFDSLDELVQNELMDGENKIQCDVCVQKKTTNRRACINKLPNLMVLHLKRFDLDYQTFETVKLNNKMEFPFDAKLNMFKYTKEGLEWEEKKKEKVNEEALGSSPKPSHIQYENTGLVEPDMSDYEYDLQGVLVHSGVAQGGHYYSFSRDPECEDKWYKFDDEDVTNFNLDQIPAQCFGGPAHSNYSGVEEDRTSNALILFYKKTRKVDESLSQYESDMKSMEESMKSLSASNSDKNVPGMKLIDGNEAFLHEVNDSNLQHALSCYLLDSELHIFVRALLSLLSPSSSNDTNTTLQWSLSGHPHIPRETVNFGIHFLLDVILHCRERAAIQLWINTLRDAFQSYPDTALSLLKGILTEQSIDNNNWIQEYLLNCTDANARHTFVQVLFHAVAAIAPSNADALDAVSADLKNTELIERGDVPSLLYCLVKVLILDKLMNVHSYLRTADELFVLIRELAGIPCINHAMVKQHAICRIAFFAMPESAPKAVKEAFLKGFTRQYKIENFYLLVPCVLEALAAILGVPQIRKVPLTTEGTHWDNVELVPEAKDAFTIIFNEQTDNGRIGMDVHDIVAYKEKTNGPKISVQQARLILDRFQRQDGRLNLVGFLQYYADLAFTNPRDVWRDLQAFGFKNDLTRTNSHVQDPSSKLYTDLKKSTFCRDSLKTIALYEAGLQQAEGATKAVLTRVCYNEKEDSLALLYQALSQLYVYSRSDYNYGYDHSSAISFIELIKFMINIDDNLAHERFVNILLDQKFGLICVYYVESTQPSKCRANEYEKYTVSRKYIEWLRCCCMIPRFYQFLELKAESDEYVMSIKRKCRLRPGAVFSEMEEELMRETIIVVSNAGSSEVNGEYRFKEIMCEAGFYYRMGVYQGKPAYFTLYKVKMKKGDYNWFISKTPEGKSPGTQEDHDFYSVPFDDRSREPFLPPKKWTVRNDGISKTPAPTLTFLYPSHMRIEDYTSESSDSELEHSGDNLNTAYYYDN